MSSHFAVSLPCILVSTHQHKTSRLSVCRVETVAWILTRAANKHQCQTTVGGHLPVPGNTPREVDDKLCLTLSCRIFAAAGSKPHMYGTACIYYLANNPGPGPVNAARACLVGTTPCCAWIAMGPALGLDILACQV